MKWGIAVVLGCLLSGCATVVNGPNIDYAVKSEPEGARVVFSNGVECVTPCDLELKRRNSLRADITKDGYNPEYVLIQSKGGGATVGNVLAGGVIGVLVDSGNGSNNFLSPRPLNVKLVPVGSTEAAQMMDDEGNVTGTVMAHNDEVREKVVETLGRQLAGYEDPAPQVAAAAPQPASTAPVTEEQQAPVIKFVSGTGSADDTPDTAVSSEGTSADANTAEDAEAPAAESAESAEPSE